MNDFFCKRNQVYPVLFNGQAAVEKHFERQEDWSRERKMYSTLGGKLALPRILNSQPGLLVLEYLPFPHLLAVLEKQERFGFDPAPWLTLGAWLETCKHISGKLPSDGNLRNFLWDAGAQQIIGLDLENYEAQLLENCAAAILAYIQEYTPKDTSVKHSIVELLSNRLGISKDRMDEARHDLLMRRKKQGRTPATGVILAGGQSRRMGQCKAALPLMGKTLLEWQVEKLIALGLDEVLISGPAELGLPGTHAVPDVYPQRGPLGGLHACLSTAQNPICLVVTVDMPLTPPQTLAQLCKRHNGGVTILVHGGKWEPLCAVYDSSLALAIPPLICEGGAPVRLLLKQAPTAWYKYRGPEELLVNCNTPSGYEDACGIVRRAAEQGLPLL